MGDAHLHHPVDRRLLPHRLRRRAWPPAGLPAHPRRGRGPHVPGVVEGHRLLVSEAGTRHGHQLVGRCVEDVERHRPAAHGVLGHHRGVASGVHLHRRAEPAVYGGVLADLPQPGRGDPRRAAQQERVRVHPGRRGSTHHRSAELPLGRRRLPAASTEDLGAGPRIRQLHLRVLPAAVLPAVLSGKVAGSQRARRGGCTR